MGERAAWFRPTDLGREKIFEARRFHCDLTFLDEFLTEDFCRRQKLFVFGQDRRRDQWVVESREFEEIKKALLFRLTNAGTPVIDVVDANFRNRSELHLRHTHDGVDLRVDWAKETLAALARLWKRPVQISTIVEGRARRLGHDGSQPTDESIDAPILPT